MIKNIPRVFASSEKRRTHSGACVVVYTAVSRKVVEKVYATILKGIVGGFEFTVLQRNSKELAQKAMKMCLRVLTERNKVGSTATVVRNSISIISHITFWDCRVHIFSDNLSRNSCIT